MASRQLTVRREIYSLVGCKYRLLNSSGWGFGQQMNIIEFINDTKLMNSVLLTFTTQIRTQLLSQPGQQ